MKKILLLLCLQSVFVFGQAPAIEWQKSYGGSGNDRARSIQQTTDGGYIVAGSSNSNNGDVSGNHGNTDCWIVKLNASGNVTWQKSLGGSGNEEGESIQQTTDGGYIVAVSSNSNDGDVSGNHGNYDVWVVKLNSSGNITWQKSLGGAGSDSGSSIQQTTDGGYIVVGSSNSNNGNVTGNHGLLDVWVVKLNSLGNISWQRSFGGTNNDQGYSIQQTSDGGYIVAGSSESNNGDVTGNHGSYDCWILKLNSTGSIVWQKSFGGTGVDVTYSIRQTTDGGYIMAGRSISSDGDVTENNGNYDYWIIKLDTSGNIIWQKSFGGVGLDQAFSIRQTVDGGYIVGGYSGGGGGDVTMTYGGTDYWIIKLDNTGNIMWQKSLGGTGSDTAFPIQQTSDGGYIVAGYSNSNDGDVTGNHGGNDYWIVKLAKECSPVTNTVTVAACESFTWTTGNGQTYTSSTTASHTIVGGAVNGCDSTITLNLTINQPTTHTITETACESYTLNSQTYTSSGAYTQTLTNANNCDSIITLNLTINQPTTHTITETACESYTLNTQMYTSSGTYTQTLTNANNCDSTITLNLTINQPSTHTITETACESYTLNAQTYTSSGTYTQTLTNANNCDSIITLNLTINQPTAHTITETACESYTLNTQTYTSSGTYTQVLNNANNCDSTITLNLTINSVDNTVSVSGITLTANQMGAIYQWIDCDNGNTPISGETAQSFEPIENGNYAVEVTANGCMETSECIIASGLGIAVPQSMALQIYPNPTNTVFTVAGAPVGATLIVTDLAGKVIYESEITTKETVVETHSFTNGVYLVNVKKNGVRKIEKLVVNR